MAQSTVYDVQVNYKMGGDAGAGIKDIGKSAQQAEAGLGSLKGAIGSVVAALGLVKGFEAGKKAFVDFNSMLEQSTVSIAAQEKMLKGGKWDDAMKNATGLVAHYVQVAKASVNTTEDFVKMHQGIAGAGYRIGMTNDEIKQMTTGAVLLSSAFGESAQYVSLEVKEMLSGVVNARQRVPAILLASQNKTREEFAKMNQKAKRELILNALKDPALLQAAKAMEFTWKGVTSTLKDNLQIALGKVGLPLFKALSGEVKSWNAWIDDNGQKLERWGKAFGEGLISAFSTVKEIVATIAPIAQLGGKLLAEAAAFYKENGWLKHVTGWHMAKQGVKAASGLAKAADESWNGSKTYQKLKSQTDEWYGARGAERKALDKQRFFEDATKTPGDPTKDPNWQKSKADREAAVARQLEVQKHMLDTAAEARIVTKEEKNGVTTYSPTGSKEETMRELVTDKIGKVTNDEIEARRLFIKTLYDDIFTGQRKLEFGEKEKKEDERAKKLSPEHHKVNVNIHKIEVASPDPDRFVFGMVRSFKQVVANPVTAASTIRGGF